MNLLALDTSTEYCSCAVWRNGEVLARGELAGQRHSEILLPMIDGLLKEADLTLKRLDGIAFGAGPGSFTGIRIACSVVQGLALGADLPVIPVCTLEALAEQADANRFPHPGRLPQAEEGNEVPRRGADIKGVVAALDARLDEVYVAYYHRLGEAWQPMFGPTLCSIADTPALTESGWAGIGSGFLIQGGALARHLGLQGAWVNGTCYPEAGAIARLGAAALARGEGRDAADAQPIYLRNKVALTIEERLERKRA
jgi:tRNA threonylcarbamoyladenosine biosynthesis protein TsaB